MEDKDMKQEQEQNLSDQLSDEMAPEQPETTTPKNELEELKIELAEQKDKFIRLYAEFDNFKRRNAKERIELMQTAGRDVIQSLLEVMDDFERAEKQMAKSDDLEQIKKGFELILSKFRNTLSSKGLKEMKSIGEEFNPDLHEAITEIDVADDMKGKVVDEVEKGYTLNEKIIRFSKVVVGK
jgi:molecular chaperone GrpE